MPNGAYLKPAVYDKVKFAVQIVLPATSAFYFGLSAIWGLPAAEQVVGTIALITVFLGAILGLSSKAYDASDAKYDGDVVLTTDPGGVAKYELQFNGPLESILDHKDIRFKVVESPT